MIDFRSLHTDRRPSFSRLVARQALRILSIPYRFVVAGRNWLYDHGWMRSYRSELIVISVGNLSVGGTGKSPVVAWIAQWLRSRDVPMAILSRGYGKLESGQNDEALELELQFPGVSHLQHWDRVASARRAEEELGTRALLLDDAFQHRRIARDLDIVLIDATDPASARRVLPGGLLREPFSNLRRADIVVLTRADQVHETELQALRSQVRHIAPRASLVEAAHKPSNIAVFPTDVLSLETLRGMRVLAFCGIGNPDSFFCSLEQLGATIVDRRTWPDHHRYNADDLQTLSSWGEGYSDAEMFVCTMKDWVKLQTAKIGNLRIGALRIDLDILAGHDELENRMRALIENKPTQRS